MPRRAMDPRGTATATVGRAEVDQAKRRRRTLQRVDLVTAPQGVARLAAAAGVAFENVDAARQRTENGLERRRQDLEGLQIDAEATVVLMGSWGRYELTSESDDDFMVLFGG